MMTYRVASAALIAAVGLELSACASVITQYHQDLMVTTPMADGANCSLENMRGMWTVQTPGTVRVLKSKDDMQIRCTRPGFQDAQGVALVGIEPWFWGNFAIGGAIGMGLDWADGSIHKYRPAVIPMRPSAGAANTALPVTQPISTAGGRPPTS